MGRKLSANEEIYGRDDRTESSNDSVVLKNKGVAGEKANTEKNSNSEEKKEENLVEILWQTQEHFFPCFNEWLDSVKDPRNPALITYWLKTILWTVLLIFVLKREARRALNVLKKDDVFLHNLKQLCKQMHIKEIPHGDTLDYSLSRIEDWHALEKIKVKMAKRLIRKRSLEKFRMLDKYYQISIDAVHVHTFTEQHCDQCLKKKQTNGEYLWMHIKLVASLVTENGLCFPVLTEWIENSSEEYEKQDCELKALYRLLPRLREEFGRMPICVVLDGLYACEPVFKLLEKHRLEWMIVFKKGSIPTLYEYMEKSRYDYKAGETHEIIKTKEIQARSRRTHEERIKRIRKSAKRMRTVESKFDFWWHKEFKNWNSTRSYNAIYVKEVTDGKKKCEYTWLISDKLAEQLNKQTVEELTQAGRCRWKTENEGFNTLKNMGYNLEHPYSQDKIALKCWHELMDIGFILNQLIEKGSLINVKNFGKIASIAATMYNHFHGKMFMRAKGPLRIQIRFEYNNTS